MVIKEQISNFFCDLYYWLDMYNKVEWFRYIVFSMCLTPTVFVLVAVGFGYCHPVLLLFLLLTCVITCTVIPKQVLPISSEPDNGLSQDALESLRQYYPYPLNITATPAHISVEEAEEIDRCARALIREHVTEVPEFSKVNPRQFLGKTFFFSSPEDYKKIWGRYHKITSTNCVSAVHVPCPNCIYCELLFITSKEDLLRILLHEHLHSYTKDESLAEYATLFIMLRWGNIKERSHAASAVGLYISSYPSDAYADSIYYIYKHLRKENYFGFSPDSSLPGQ